MMKFGNLCLFVTFFPLVHDCCVVGGGKSFPAGLPASPCDLSSACCPTATHSAQHSLACGTLGGGWAG